jgi:hypothetical protein
MHASRERDAGTLLAENSRSDAEAEASVHQLPILTRTVVPCRILIAAALLRLLCAANTVLFLPSSSGMTRCAGPTVSRSPVLSRKQKPSLWPFRAASRRHRSRLAKQGGQTYGSFDPVVKPPSIFFQPPLSFLRAASWRAFNSEGPQTYRLKWPICKRGIVVTCISQLMLTTERELLRRDDRRGSVARVVLEAPEQRLD